MQLPYITLICKLLTLHGKLIITVGCLVSTFLLICQTNAFHQLDTLFSFSVFLSSFSLLTSFISRFPELNTHTQNKKNTSAKRFSISRISCTFLLFHPNFFKVAKTQFAFYFNCEKRFINSSFYMTRFNGLLELTKFNNQLLYLSLIQTLFTLAE